MRKLVVVTGGAGFIGSNLVGALARRGDVDVLVCDRMGRDERWRNLAGHEIAGIVAPDRLIETLEGEKNALDAVIHMGALSSTTETDVGRFVEDNIRPSLALWRFCATHGKRLIYASSAAVYGDGQAGFDDDPTPEGLSRLKPLNAYGWSKLVVDRRCTRLAALGAPAPAQWAGLRFFNVYGPNERHKGDMQSVVTKNFATAGRGDPVMLFASGRPGIPDGGQRRDFVYVKDCVRVVQWLLDNPHVNGLFNVGTGRAQSFAELIGALFRACGREPNIVYRPMPPALEGRYQYFTEARLERLRRAGYAEPFHDVERGVADYVTNHLTGGDGTA